MNKRKLFLYIFGAIISILVLAGIVTGIVKLANKSVTIGIDGFKQHKILIAYYAPDEGTRAVANELGSIIGGEKFAIEPEVAYPKDQKEYIKRIKTEKRAKNPPAIKNSSFDISKYDIVFVGTPMILYTMAPSVKTFLKTKNFENKIVIPFIAYDKKLQFSVFNDMKRLVPKSYFKKGFASQIKNPPISHKTTIKFFLNNMKFSKKEVK